MRSDLERLKDIELAINEIETHPQYAKGEPAFADDKYFRGWIFLNLQTVGEAVTNISDQLKAKHPEVKWREIARFRNVLVHQYWGIQHERVWSVIEDHLPVLKAQVAKILCELEK